MFAGGWQAPLLKQVSGWLGCTLNIEVLWVRESMANPTDIAPIRGKRNSSWATYPFISYRKFRVICVVCCWRKRHEVYDCTVPLDLKYAPWIASLSLPCSIHIFWKSYLLADFLGALWALEFPYDSFLWSAYDGLSPKHLQSTWLRKRMTVLLEQEEVWRGLKVCDLLNKREGICWEAKWSNKSTRPLLQRRGSRQHPVQ